MSYKRILKKAGQALRENRILSGGILAFAAASGIIIYLLCLSYFHYRNGLIKTEQDELLTMAETVGKSLVSFIDQELLSLDLYFSAVETADSPDVSYKREDALLLFSMEYLNQKSNLYERLFCYNEEGLLIFPDSDTPVDAPYHLADFPDFCDSTITENQSLAESLSSQEKLPASICGKKLCEGGWYEMFLAKKCMIGGRTYTVIYSMNLNQLYKQIVEPVKIGQGGYSVVKDSELSIIMHHAVSQVGTDAIQDRLVRYPQLDLSNLIEWIRLQRSQPSGSGVIHSYVWNDPGLPPETRIISYTTVHLPGEDWIVNCTIPYEELDGPLLRMIWQLIFICSLLLTFLLILFYNITRNLMRSESQKKEIAYLKEINEGMELLRKKDEEIQHYQRIQSIGMMSSHIAHEFNNYLTPVMVYGELLENDETISPDNRELVKGILNSANQAAGLSRRLLDFSRQDSDVTVTAVDLTDEAERAVDMVRHLVPASIRFTAKLTGERLPVRGRKGMMEHILMNLCNNAFHAMEGREGALTVTLEETSLAPDGLTAAGPFALLSVADTGCGISKDAMDKIFEPFYTTKRSGKGTGLGLSVVRNTVTASGGQIFIDSEPGKGTTFLLYFPKLSREEMNAAGQPGNIHKMIIIDDDEELLKSLKQLLKSAPFKTEYYSHPAIVLSKIQNQQDYCDLILTDYSMPSMNGVELAEIVRKLNPGIRLFLMSGMEDNRFEWYLKNAVIDRFILKTDLNETLKEMLLKV